jgi:hypothetical protein
VYKIPNPSYFEKVTKITMLIPIHGNVSKNVQ